MFWRPKKKSSIFATVGGSSRSFHRCMNTVGPLYDSLTPRQEFIFIPSRFRFQTELNFPCTRCSMMTYFDDVNQAGDIRLKFYCSSQIKTKMMVKRLTFSFWYPPKLKSQHNQGQTWPYSSRCFFYNCNFILIYLDCNHDF